jgi:PAS domain S-box-containing protein
MSVDVSDEVGLAAELASSQAFTRSVLEFAPDAMVIVDHAGQIRLANAATEQLFGYSREELAGRPVEVLIPERSRDRHSGHRAGFSTHPHTRPLGDGLELWGVGKDGVEFPVDISLGPLRTEDGVFTIATIRDITARTRFEEDLRTGNIHESDSERLRAVGAEMVQTIAEQEALRRELSRAQRETAESLTLLEALQATAPVGFGFVDREFRIRRLNATLASVGGQPAEEQLGRKVAEVVPEIWKQLEPVFVRVIETGRPIVNRPVRGVAPATPRQVRRWLASYYPVRVEGEIIGVGVVVIDITERHEADEFRSVVMDNMAEGMCVTDEQGRLILMNAAASRMTGWSEDELRGTSLHDAIHYQHADGSPLPEDACELVKASAAGEPARVADNAFTRKDGSIFPVAYSSAPLRSGSIVRGAVVVFHDTTEEKAEQTRVRRELDALSWVGRIRDALDEDRLVLYSQPIAPLTAAAQPSKELLLRMVGPKGEIILPGSFLPVAERYGQIGEIDQWVITQAVRLAAKGHRVQANLSADSIDNLDLLRQIARELSETGADPANVVFEITETALMGHIEAGEAFARGITDIGCALALDDFGTGYGSFTYLQKLPIAFLKIDIEFVRDLVSNKANQHLVQATVNIAQGFGQQTIAEGVEDAETQDLLREYGVDLVQGFHIGHPEPLPADDPPHHPARLETGRAGSWGQPGAATQPHYRPPRRQPARIPDAHR